jgi:hypothetical protein
MCWRFVVKIECCNSTTVLTNPTLEVPPIADL